MSQPLPDSEPELRHVEPRNPWAVVDLIVFAVFSLVMFLVLMQFAGVPVVYAIVLQGLFNLALVGFAAGWVRLVRGIPFKNYIHFFRSHTFSTKSLVLLGVGLALSVLFISAFLPSTGPTPLEKLLTSRNAIVMFAIFGVVAAPILEELIFRGFLFEVLWEIGGSRLAGLVTAILFALLHAPQLEGKRGGAVLIFIVGCVLSVVRQRSNSVIPSVIVHTSYNSTVVALGAIGSLVQKFAK